MPKPKLSFDASNQALTIKPEQKFSMNLRCPGQTLKVKTRVAWVIADFNESWLGLELINPTGPVAEAIDKIIRSSAPKQATSELASNTFTGCLDRWCRSVVSTFTSKTKSA